MRKENVVRKRIRSIDPLMLITAYLPSKRGSDGVSESCKFIPFCIFKIYSASLCVGASSKRNQCKKWRKNVHHLCIWSGRYPGSKRISWNSLVGFAASVPDESVSSAFEEVVDKDPSGVCPTSQPHVVTHWKPEQCITIAKENDDDDVSGWISIGDDGMLSWWDKKNVVFLVSLISIEELKFSIFYSVPWSVDKKMKKR